VLEDLPTADTTQKYAGKKRKPQIYRGMKIRPRGGSWQADFGTKAGKRDQKSFGSLDEAKQAIDTHLIQKVEQSRFEAIETKAKVIGWHNLSERQKMDALERLGGRVSLVLAADYDLEAVPDKSCRSHAVENIPMGDEIAGMF